MNSRGQRDDLTTLSSRLTSRLTALARSPATFGTIAILFATPASAAPFFVSAFAEVALANDGSQVKDTGQLNGQTSTTAQVSKTTAGQHAESIVRAQVGSLGVRVLASSDALASGGAAEGIAQFSDTLHITSSTLPFGAPFQLLFSMNLEGRTDFTGNPGEGLNSAITLVDHVAGIGHVYREILQLGKPAIITGSKTFTVDSSVGATLTVTGSLDINAQSGIESVDNSALSDYLNTAAFFATPSTPEISIVSSSGHDYSAVAPDRSVTAFLLGLSLMSFGLGRRQFSRG